MIEAASKSNDPCRFFHKCLIDCNQTSLPRQRSGKILRFSRKEVFPLPAIPSSSYLFFLQSSAPVGQLSMHLPQSRQESGRPALNAVPMHAWKPRFCKESRDLSTTSLHTFTQTAHLIHLPPNQMTVLKKTQLVGKRHRYFLKVH